MLIEVLTLFPEPVLGILGSSILERARKAGAGRISRASVAAMGDGQTSLRSTMSPSADGAGMVLKPEPLCKAVDELRATAIREGYSPYVIFPSPDGQPFTQAMAKEVGNPWQHLLFVCGRYKGVDERFRATRVDCEVSLGDFVLTGGEIASLAMIDAVVRLQPGGLIRFRIGRKR